MTRKIFSICCFFIMFSFILMYSKPELVNIEDNELTTEETSDADVTVTEDENPIVQLPGTGIIEDNLASPPPSIDAEEPETETEIEEPEEILYYCEWGDFYLSEDDYKLLLTTTFCESGGEPSETQYMVALTILNRVVAGMGGDTVRDIVYAKNAFSVIHWKDFENRGWTDKVEKSVQKALKENPHPRNMYYFRTGHYHSWAKDYKKSGDVYFSTKK